MSLLNLVVFHMGRKVCLIYPTAHGYVCVTKKKSTDSNTHSDACAQVPGNVRWSDKHTGTHAHTPTPPLSRLSIMREITPWVRGRGMKVSDNDDGGCFWTSGDLQAKKQTKKRPTHVHKTKKKTKKLEGERLLS